MADVFISYARLDRERIAPLKPALEALGLTVFFDVEGLDGGDRFPDILDREVKSARAVLGCWTKQALSRDWVKTECAIADEQRSLIPVEFEKLAALDIPAAFYQLQRVDLSSWRGERRHDGWLAAVRAISRKLARPEIYDRARAVSAVPTASSVSRHLPAQDMDALWKDWEQLSLSGEKAAVEALKMRAEGTPVETLALSRVKDLERPAAARLLTGSQAVGRPPLRGWRLVQFVAVRAALASVIIIPALFAVSAAKRETAIVQKQVVEATETVKKVQAEAASLAQQLEAARAAGAYQFRPRNEFMRTTFEQGVSRYFEEQPGGAPKAGSTQIKFRDAIIARADLFAAYGLDTPERAAAFLGQVAHETGKFRTVTENVNYSAALLKRLFPKHFPTDEIAEQYARKPEDIANRIYEGKFGNTEPGDGWRFRGRGFFQFVGRSNYARLSQLLGFDLVADPDFLENPEVALAAAVVYWKERKLNALADARDVPGITRGIAGRSSIGLANRQAETEHWLDVFGATSAVTQP